MVRRSRHGLPKIPAKKQAQNPRRRSARAVTGTERGHARDEKALNSAAFR
jgi:hypothetical protein